MKNIVVLIFIAFIAGCATSQTAPTLSQSPKPIVSSDKAVLFIFRDHAEPVALVAYLEIENTKVASLRQNGFTWLYVTPGKKNIKYMWPILAGMPIAKFEYEFEAGKTYAFEMTGKSIYMGYGFSTATVMKEMDITEAREIIESCCHYVLPVLSEM